MKAAALSLALLLLALPARAEVAAGFEGDDRRGYGYLSYLHPIPLQPGQDVLLWTTASYRYYDILDAGGTTTVRGPGIGAGATWRWRVSDRLSVAAGPGWEYRWIERELPTGQTLDEPDSGVLLQGALGYRIADRTFLDASAGYAGADDWTSSRAMLLQQIGDGLRLGPEVGWQGNDDVRVFEVGGVAQVPWGDEAWLGVRAGQARERYRGGLEETRPYFSVSVGRSF